MNAKDLIWFMSKPLLLDKSCTTGTQAIILKSKNRFERTKDISFQLHGSGCIILQHKLVKTIKLQHRRQLRQFSTQPLGALGAGVCCSYVGELSEDNSQLWLFYCHMTSQLIQASARAQQTTYLLGILLCILQYLKLSKCSYNWLYQLLFSLKLIPNMSVLMINQFLPW